MAPSKRVSAAAQEQSRKKSRTSAGHPEGIKATDTLSKPIDLLALHVVANSAASFVLDTWPTYEQFPQAEGVYKIQAREGVGAAIQGFATAVALSGSATKPVSVLATADSLTLLAPTLATLSAQGASVVVSVAANSNNTAELFAALKLLSLSASGWKGELLFSGGKGPKQVLETTASAYAKPGKVVIHVFDDLEAAQEQILFDTPSGQATDAFTYVGHASPEVLLLLPSSLHASLAVAALTAMESPATSKIAILSVNEINDATFADDLMAFVPHSVQSIHVPTADSEFGQAESWFYDLALSSVTSSGKSTASVLPLPVVSFWTVKEWASTLVRIASPSSSKAFVTPKLKSLLPAQSKLASFWSADSDASSKVAPAIAVRFAQLAQQGEGVVPRLLETFDNFAGGKSAKGLGVKNSELLLSPAGEKAEYDAPLSALSLTSEPSLIFISDPQFILASYNAIERAGSETQIIFASKWAPEEYKEKLGKHEKNKLTGHNNIWTINPDAVAKEAGVAGEEGVALVEQVVFWTKYLQSNQAALSKVLEGTFSQDTLNKVIDGVSKGLQVVDLTPSDMEVDEEEKAVPMHQLAPGEGDHSAMTHPAFIKAHNAATTPNTYKSSDEPTPTSHNSIKLVAQQFLYPEAYAVPNEEKEKMRPDLHEENFVITVSENRRLTPDNYDRNVFHMEFDTAGTGLKYSVGEALGIHGLNDEQEVKEFIEWCGLNGEDLVSFPSHTDPNGRLEVRTVFQLFQQTLDIFGKPPKAFYETLSKYADSREESRHLRFIASAEGSSTFKKWAELETVTYVDVLKAFPSTRARFGLEEMVAEISTIKPRHYSIASSQNAVGDSVHLLIVTVDWETSGGQKRFGQCTRYLAGLPVGAKVMVSIKPSVMKLPPRDTQPIIMAGLGTGAAPFRAFMQERAWQRAQGIDVGPLLYYFGARYRSAEFLYGEEIEAYVRDGVISHTGLAFSRDTKQKVYIQHKMMNDSKLLAELLEDGVFYLCGPTWPVPDVYKALTTALETKGKSIEQAEAYIEELKEDERYVLEVY